jgi:electron-transferring-flavoprotein dehydrogenase
VSTCSTPSAPAAAPPTLRARRRADSARRTAHGVKHHAFELPWTPAFLHKHGGLVMSMGQFNQWVGSQLMATGTVQIWPGTPVERAALRRHEVSRRPPRRSGRRQIRRARGHGFMPGMDVRAQLTVVGDGPVGAVGRQLDEQARPARRARTSASGRWA